MNAKTLNDLFFHATRNVVNPKMFQRKVDGVYEGVRAQVFERLCMETALGLETLGLSSGDRVGLISTNCLEWAQCDYGILLGGAVNVPIYPTLMPEQIAYILDNSACGIVICQDAEQSAKVLEVREQLKDLKQIIQIIDPVASDDVLLLEDIRVRGAERFDVGAEALEKRAAAVEPGQTCSIIYTSGTTGNPKGVVLSHWNIVSNVLAALQVFSIGREDTALSFLPLSHIFERMAGYYTMLYAGTSIAYAESIDTVPQNLQEVRPTIMVSVPRLYEKMYARILDTALSGSFIKKNIFFWAKRVGERWADLDIDKKPVPAGLDRSYKIALKLVFSKLQERTGGKLRYFISGGAPLAPEIAKFFYAAGLGILEGYGLTETSPVITANTFDAYRLGCVGKPMPGVEVKIAIDGEILTRGPNVMQGYYRNPEATKAVIDDEGWFATGDIGEIDADGFLRITDRKKDILVTAGGKNIAPQPIEGRFKQDKFITECVLLGDAKPFIAALIVPNFEYLLKYAKRKEIIYTSTRGLINDPKVQDLFRRRVEQLNSTLARFEQVKQFRLLDQELTLEGGELTPSLKVRRREVLKKYSDLIETIYPE
jgi:long-chain acyl-CoA synthetase